MKYLTNKKLITSIIIASGIIGGAFWYASKKTVYVKERSAQQISSEKQLQQLAKINKDSDGDGLKDWEEALWGSDPNNQDTDDDGSLDGEEIAQNRDPLIPGPNDALSLNTDRGSLSKTKNQEDLTLTEKATQTLLTNYAALKNSNEPLDSYARQELLKSALEDLANQEDNDLYGLDVIQTNLDAGQEAAGQYAALLQTAFKKHFGSLKENELLILGEVMSSGIKNSQALEKFKAHESAYKNLAKELLEMQVPESYAQIHLTFINSSTNVGKAIVSFQKMFTDPFQALLGIRQYMKEGARLTQNYQDLRNKLAEDNVQPDEKNLGYIFAKKQ